MQIPTLIARQNPDGGWPYRRGSSWTEPTVYALMALLASGETAPARRGFDWLRAHRRSDGGWPSKPGVDQSSWATGLVALLPPQALGEAAHASAIAWLLETTGQESTFIHRARQWMLGVPIPPDQQFAGWPWTPGAAAWVGPTAIAILALERELRSGPRPQAASRVAAGRNFLLSRTCREGGWNHGSAIALGYAAQPYPETTGLALAALRGVRSSKVEAAIGVALRFLNESPSADAQNWLRLGLLAQGRLPVGYNPAPAVQYRSVPEIALNAVCAAGPAGRDWLGA